MKDEIKEILDSLKYTAKKHTIQVLENGGKIEHCPQEIETELRLNTYSANILYDYITNLQTIEQQYSAILSENAELENKITNLEEENERLKEILKWKQNRESELFTIESVLETNKQLYDERNIYKSRNEKAIEYIEERKNLNWYADGVFVYELLNILEGDKDE